MGGTSVRILALLLALAGAITTVLAKSDDVSAAMVASEVLVDNGLADTTFKIEVVNRGASPAANVRVVFADGGEVIVGDVAAEGSAFERLATAGLRYLRVAHAQFSAAGDAQVFAGGRRC